MKPKSFNELVKNTVLTKSPATWGGLSFFHEITPSIPLIRHGITETPCLFFTTSGRLEGKGEIGGNDFQLVNTSGSLSYLDRDFEIENFTANGEQSGFRMELDFQKIEQLTGKDLIAGALLSRYLPRHITDKDQHIGALMAGVETEILNDCPSGTLYAESISLTIVSYLWGKYSVRHSIRELNGLSPAKFSILMEYFRENIGRDISLLEMGGIIDMSPKHLCRCFKQATGESPYQYLLKLRINEAKRLLRKGSFSMTEVAYSTGFSSPSHFSTTFRKSTGMSPRSFQKNF